MDDIEKIELVYDPSAAEEYRKEHPEMYQKPVRMEIEGGGYNWFYVCGECHVQVKVGDKECGCCHSKLLWDEAELRRNTKDKMQADDFETAYFAGYQYGYQMALKDLAKHMKGMRTYGGYKKERAAGVPEHHAGRAADHEQKL